MKMHMFAVQDVQAQAFMQPMFCQSQGVAIRMIADEVNRPAQDNVLYQHPEDFRLFSLGSWDNESGAFDLAPQPVLVVDASALKR
uniref:DNA binding protein VP4 n=1 Tax=Gokushovirinae environmental samples TaxID=1478972 RepID=A0A2R3UAB4_9VIRU|nr:DNA binding protein VP4 [Gokushovirinae environmental samples]